MKHRTATATKPTTEKPPTKIKGTREYNEQERTLWLVEKNDPSGNKNSPSETWEPIGFGGRRRYKLCTEEDARRGAINLGMHAASGSWAPGSQYRIRNVISGTVKRINVNLKVTTSPARAIHEPVEFEVERRPKKERFYVIGERNGCTTHHGGSQCSNNCMQVPVWSFIDVPASRNSTWISSKPQIEFPDHNVAGYATMWGAVKAVEWLDRHKVPANILDDKTGRLIRYEVIIGQGRMLGSISKNGLRIKAVAEPWIQMFCPDVWVA